MKGSLRRSRQQGFACLREKLASLGLGGEEADAIFSRIDVATSSDPSVDIKPAGSSHRRSTILIEGVACLYERLENGGRQIFSFQYPGDFCDLNRHLLPTTGNEVAIAAITRCTVGTISHTDLEQLVERYPSLGLALWRAAMLEASILRKRLLSIGRQSALQRVAHLLCEQLARREAAGIDHNSIPLSQSDLADAVGLSIVHVNRTFKELQRQKLLSKDGRAMKVVDKQGLARLASFDGNYLNMPQLLSRWQVKIEARGPVSLASTKP